MQTHQPRFPRWWPPIAGVLSGALGLAVGELWASTIGGAGPVVTVGDRVIDGVPRSVKEFAIRTFGTNDKVALIVGVLVITALYSSLVGVAGSKKFARGVAGIALFALVGIFAATTGRDPSLGDLGPIICAMVVAVGGLWLLVGRSRYRQDASSSSVEDPETSAVRNTDVNADASTLGTPALARPSVGALDVPTVNRRQLFALGGGTAAAAALAAAGSRITVGPDPVRASSQPIPEGVSKLAKPPAGVAVDIADMTPWLTPNASFYRIDTALVIPRIDSSTWSMKVFGMVDNEITISYADIRNGRFGPLLEHDCTMMCVSNEVGGRLIGNARWTGVRLRDVLSEAKPQAPADQVFARSVEGFTAGFPKALIDDGREALLVIGMNGEPLSAKHGYPARLVVPGIYGYVSAVKWLESIKLTTFQDDEGYWIPRGWSALGPIKTGSRIDVVGTAGVGGTVTAGKVPIGGVAWAQHTGVSKVEVQINDEPWRTATLASDGGIDTWRQWRYDWDAPEGVHIVSVRATDSTGFTQSAKYVDVAPDGAEGYHRIGVKVEKAAAA